MTKDFSLQDSITKKRKKKSKGMVMKNIETKYILKSLLAQLANIDTSKKKKKKTTTTTTYMSGQQAECYYGCAQMEDTNSSHPLLIFCS